MADSEPRICVRSMSDLCQIALASHDDLRPTTHGRMALQSHSDFSSHVLTLIEPSLQAGGHRFDLGTLHRSTRPFLACENGFVGLLRAAPSRAFAYCYGA